MQAESACIWENSYFDDIVIGSEITLDVDLYVDDWLKAGYAGLVNKILDLEKRYNIKIKAWYRVSSHQNVHVKMKFPQPLTMLECLLFRAWFDDDQVLLIIDMKRYFKTMDKDHRFMRRFDCKGKINDAGEYEISKAGPWITIKE